MANIPEILHWAVDPAMYPVTQGYGEYNPDLYKDYGFTRHNGIDQGTPEGTPFTPTDEGEVVYAKVDGKWGINGGYGLYVKVKHAWGYSIYAHLSEVYVKAGQRVDMGTALGRTGNTGNSTGPHLHTEWRRLDDKPFAPGQYLAAVGSQQQPDQVEIDPNWLTVTATDGLRLHTEPDIDSHTIVALPFGTRLPKGQVKGDWIKVVGYIHKDWIK